MTRHKIYLIACRQGGVGLIEVMISLVIGLVLLGGLAYFLIGSQQMYRIHDDVSRMQESGRNALELMGREIRQAGYRSNTDVDFIGALSGTNGANGAPDTITIQYDAQEGGEANCMGTNFFSGSISNTFALNNADPSGLTCNNAPVVDNIIDMQITYGIDATKDGNLDGDYISATSVTEFGQVAAVRVSLLVRGPAANIATNKSQTYYYNGEKLTATDGFLRQVYTSTFTVRNQAK